MKHQQRGVVIVENNFLPLLKKTARSFYLTIRLLPKRLQEPVALAYLLARASDTIADEVEAPQEERQQLLLALQGHLDHPQEKIPFPLLARYCKNYLKNHSLTEEQQAEKELLASLPKLLKRLDDPTRNLLETDAIKEAWRMILEGQRLDLIKQGTLFMAAEREYYLYLVAGCVGVFWTKLGKMHFTDLSQESTEQMMAWGISYGKGLQLVNILRDAPVDQQEGRFYFDPAERSKLISQAHACFQEGRLYLHALKNYRFRYASSLPLLLGKQTLELLAKHPSLPFLKVKRWKVLVILIRGLFF